MKRAQLTVYLELYSFEGMFVLGSLSVRLEALDSLECFNNVIVKIPPIRNRTI
jgi:hypothetical protein